MAAEAAAKVKSIFLYPIKSCRGISVSESPISATGFRWDRQWMVVNSRGRACTQRVDPKLALVETRIWGEEKVQSRVWEITYFLTLIRAPGMDELKVSLCKPPQTCDGVSVWEWSGSALDEGDEASKWFTNYLGKPSRLVRFNEVSQGSLDALNELLKEPVPINRFRPNILVDRCEPFAEDLWKEIKIGNLAFHGVKLCSRCKVPTINQENAVSASEPTETLVKFRSGKVLIPGRKGQAMVSSLPFNIWNKTRVYFGQNMVCEDLPEGNEHIIKLGDPVYVINTFASYEDTST
ncbi:Molybdenum cofactor sulfurase, C-terminal [Cynara cardunculus var. scolymus]|uniref:Molybdenum cofactor sulfurase, C-terminal n=1 Tax=Cynara cardunculus var. scolymus TaxID=59895 RepID=A0A103Y686_CYNCS|nr:Molybdenum cofactor sulfurase, C-terminal [Cynara cardunculus var. scolymus]